MNKVSQRMVVLGMLGAMAPNALRMLDDIPETPQKRPLTDADQQRLADAQAKRQRKLDKRKTA